MSGASNPSQITSTGRVIAVSSNNLSDALRGRGKLMSALQDAGYRVVLITPNGFGRDQLESRGIDFHPVAIDARGLSPLRDLATMLAFRRALRRSGAAAFLGFTIKPNIYGSLAAHSLSIPVINNITGLGEVFGRDGPLTKLVRGLYRAALKRSSVVFFQNSDDRQLLTKLGLVRSAQAKLLPGSGVDLTHFSPGADDVAADKTVFLLAGRLLWAKGIGEFAAAARMLRANRDDLEFRILGSVEPRSKAAVGFEHLRAWETEGIITYLGPADDIRPHFAAADCIVLPSYYREGVPRVLLEGAAMGKPLISADTPGCRNAVDHGTTGFLCEPRSADSLADAIERVAALSADERRAMGAAGRAKMEAEFDQEIVHRAYLEALANLT